VADSVSRCLAPCRFPRGLQLADPPVRRAQRGKLAFCLDHASVGLGQVEAALRWMCGQTLQVVFSGDLVFARPANIIERRTQRMQILDVLAQRPQPVGRNALGQHRRRIADADIHAER